MFQLLHEIKSRVPGKHDRVHSAYWTPYRVTRLRKALVGNDQEKAQLEKNPTPKTEVGKN